MSYHCATPRHSHHYRHSIAFTPYPEGHGSSGYGDNLPLSLRVALHRVILRYDEVRQRSGDMAVMTDKEILKQCSGVTKTPRYKVDDQAIRRGKANLALMMTLTTADHYDWFVGKFASHNFFDYHGYRVYRRNVCQPAISIPVEEQHRLRSIFASRAEQLLFCKNSYFWRLLRKNSYLCSAIGMIVSRTTFARDAISPSESSGNMSLRPLGNLPRSCCVKRMN